MPSLENIAHFCELTGRMDYAAYLRLQIAVQAESARRIEGLWEEVKRLQGFAEEAKRLAGLVQEDRA